MAETEINGKPWSKMTYNERRAHLDTQIQNSREPFFKRVLLAMAEHGIGWSNAMKVVESESSRIRRDGDQ